MNWQPITTAPEGVTVSTKIDDGAGAVMTTPKKPAAALDNAAALNATLADFGQFATNAAAELGRALQALRKTKTGGRNGGPPLRYPRCPCGIMTAARAAQRNHRCVSTTPTPPQAP